MAVMQVEPVELALAACLETMATTENMETTLQTSPPAFSKHSLKPESHPPNGLAG